MTKAKTKASHIYQKKNHLDEPKDVWENIILRNEETKAKLCGSNAFHYICSKTRTTHQKKSIILSSFRHGGGSVMVRNLFATSGPGGLAITDGGMNSVLYQTVLKNMHQSVIFSPTTFRLGSRTVIQSLATSPCLNAQRN